MLQTTARARAAAIRATYKVHCAPALYDSARRYIASSQIRLTPGTSTSTHPTPAAASSKSSTAKRAEENPIRKFSTKRTPERLLSSPTFVALVKGLAWLLGHNTMASTAIRETRNPYALCADRDTMEANYLHEECKLARTYQTWFQVTNLHVWLLTARYRALPPSHGRLYVQELVNHFFLDVEHRMRHTLNHKAPERVIKDYLKEMRDQWAGAGLAFDLGLVGSDAELSGAVWRNVFAARGLDGKGEVIVRPGKEATAREAAQDGSPTISANSQDFPSSSTRELVDLPFHLYVFTTYIRCELVRLQNISDEDVMAGRVGTFGSFESHARAVERDFEMEKEERALLGLDPDVLIPSPFGDDGSQSTQNSFVRSKGKQSAIGLG